MLSIRGDNNRLEHLINEVLEDISLYGKDKNCTIFLINGELEDYEVASDEPTISFTDEKIGSSTLIDLLASLISVREGTKLGALLKANRLASNLTQQELANKLGVNYQHYQKWEYGERTPDGLNILKLIEILDLDKDEIMEALEKD